jgi:hypothetical protein
VSTFFLVIALLFVVSVLALVVYSVFELTPYARHKDRYRDPATGERRFDSPRLD